MYTESVDIWGAGVILYFMLIGDIPFKTKSEEVKEYTSDVHEKFIQELSETDTISDECKDLLLNMLAYDANDRPDAQECLEHPWVKN